MEEKTWYDEIMEKDVPPSIGEIKIRSGQIIPLEHQYQCLLLCWLHRKELAKLKKTVKG
jgi:hypothetical protein